MQKQSESSPIEPFDSFDEFFEQVENRSEYWEERAKLEFTREVLVEMEKAGLSRTEFATRLGVRPAMVTRFLKGRNNFELNTMVRVARALSCRFRSHLEPIHAKTVWFDIWEATVANQNPQTDIVQFSKVELNKIEVANDECSPIAA